MWTQAAAQRDATIWYGGALIGNRANVTQAWKAFVDAIPVFNCP
jgi:hypothetical protein